MRFAAVLLAMLVLTAQAFAVQPDEVMSDPGQEARARTLSREYRCMVCQNQSIDDSDAPLARDLRLLVRERIAAGDTDRQVTEFLVARYGEFVLLKPRLSRETLLLWLIAPVVLGGGALALWLHLRRRRQGDGNAELPGLTEDEQAKLDRLMASDPAHGRPPAAT